MVDVLQASFTTLLAVFVFVSGQIFVKFFIEPLYDFKKHVGDIAEILIFYANVITNPPLKPPPKIEDETKAKIEDEEREKRLELSEILRRKASLLIPKAYMINGYWIFEKIRVVPKRSSIINARGNLIFLHNQLFDDMDPLENHRREEEVFDLLGIKQE